MLSAIGARPTSVAKRSKHTLGGDSHKIFNGGDIMQKRKQFFRNGKLKLQRLSTCDFLHQQTPQSPGHRAAPRRVRPM